ncbi:MAG: N-acetyltransferase [Succinatimonas sp.]|jgi:argininosuccinate lyase/amino-acid N-acetyltransferase|nr:N-acetyltransferase [Succinatimonas sp.]MDD5868170.1 N-acetyltransferase [Succinatimonas sp.]MDY5721576.1 N-acetyltransferase [Succinivibrio sp.]
MPPIASESSFVLLDEIKQNTLEEIYDKVMDLADKGLMTKDDLHKVNEALVTVNQVFLKQEKANFTVRQATLADVDSLMDMIEYWAKQGQNLPRKRNDIIRGIQTFAVCVKDEQVVGCACLYVYDSGLAEIRSLGVSPVIQRQGQGRAIVNYLLKRAQKMFIQRVFVLTRSPEFFSKVGFQKTVIDALPEKILKDCENCPKREQCDEVAYIYNVKDHV